MTFKAKKKVMSTNNTDVITNVKHHITIRPKQTTLEPNNLPIEITSEPTLTPKETSQIIDLSDDLTESTKEVCIYVFV
jgi:hypothetical protein